MDRIKLGKAAEFFFVSRCLLHDLECYLPVSGAGKVDVVVGNALKRCQVKAVTLHSGHQSISLRKVGCNSRTNTKVSYYSKEDVDFMVGVDFRADKIYIVPIEVATKNRRSLSVAKMSELGFENAFNLIQYIPPSATYPSRDSGLINQMELGFVSPAWHQDSNCRNPRVRRGAL